MDPLQFRSYSKWADEFGPIIRVDLATTKYKFSNFTILTGQKILTSILHYYRTVVISDYKMLKEIFSDPAFSGRMDFTIFDIAGKEKRHGIRNRL